MVLALPLALLALSAAPAGARPRHPTAPPPVPASAAKPVASCRAFDGQGTPLAEATSAVDFPDCLEALRARMRARCKGEQDLSFAADGVEREVKAEVRHLKVACGAPDSVPPPGFKKP